MESSDAALQNQQHSVQDSQVLHQELVDQLKTRRLLTTPAIEAAFRSVPRHLFLPGVPLAEVYSDRPILTKRIDGQVVSSSSQPAIMAIMLEQLDLQPSQRVLEIGAGTGYNAALMAHIVGPTGLVVTIDIDEDIVQQAQHNLAAAGYTQVQALCHDGASGYAEAAPYDRIILTVSAEDIAPAWYEQLKERGRLVMPLSLRGPQISIAFAHVGDHLESQSLYGCGFIGLRGAFASTTSIIQLASTPGQLYLQVYEPCQIDSTKLSHLLSGTYHDGSPVLHITWRDFFEVLMPWLALREPCLFNLVAQGPTAEGSNVPALPVILGERAYNTFGLCSDKGLCVLLFQHTSVTSSPDPTTLILDVSLRAFGADEQLSQRLTHHIEAWHNAGRPTVKRMHIRAYPGRIPDQQINQPDHEQIVSKRWTHFVCNW